MAPNSIRELAVIGSPRATRLNLPASPHTVCENKVGRLRAIYLQLAGLTGPERHRLYGDGSANGLTRPTAVPMGTERETGGPRVSHPPNHISQIVPKP